MPGQCPFTSKCPLFPLFVLESTSELWKERYCDTEFETCQRFQLKSAGETVDPTLLPNGNHLHRTATR